MATASGENHATDKVPKPVLLVVVGEPHTEAQKELILQRLITELTCWKVTESGVDLNDELCSLAAKAPTGEDGLYGEKMIENESEALHTIILINPCLKTLATYLRQFVQLPGNYRHLVYSGLSIRGTGCWLVQDGYYTASAFADLLRGAELCTAVKQGTVTGKMAVSVFVEGDWSESILAKAVPPPLKLHINGEPAEATGTGFVQFGGYMSGFMKVTKLADLLPASGVVGNIRFSRPTIYIFPGGQGDSALFGISGFNLLLDGGFMYRSCFWDFTRHLDRIDALLVTHIGADNLFGLSSIAERKARDPVHPEIGHIFINAIETSGHQGETGEPDEKVASLLLSLSQEASLVVDNLKRTGLVLNKCTAGLPSSAGLPSINLYHKVGHGSLDLYVLNPSHDSKALKEFFTHWSRQSNGFGARGGAVPLTNQSCICALLVWKPASPNDNVTRILFPGATPQSVIFDALDKMKMMPVFQRAVYTETLVKASSSAAAKKQPLKSTAVPISSTSQKPNNLPVAGKPEKPDQKDVKKTLPTSTVAAKSHKEIGKPAASAPPRRAAKETKEVKPNGSPHGSPSTELSTNGHESTKPETMTSPNSSPQSNSITTVSPTVASSENNLTSSENQDTGMPLSETASGELLAEQQEPVASELQATDGVEDMVSSLNLQSVPEPRLLTDYSPVEDMTTGKDITPELTSHASDDIHHSTAIETLESVNVKSHELGSVVDGNELAHDNVNEFESADVNPLVDSVSGFESNLPIAPISPEISTGNMSKSMVKSESACVLDDANLCPAGDDQLVIGEHFCQPLLEKAVDPEMANVGMLTNVDQPAEQLWEVNHELHQEIIDADKDIDTTEVVANVDNLNEGLEHVVGEDNETKSAPVPGLFDVESSSELHMPPDVVPRQDSLDGENLKEESREKFTEDSSTDVNYEGERNDLVTFNMIDLMSVPEASISTNPFVGISEHSMGLQGTGDNLNEFQVQEMESYKAPQLSDSVNPFESNPFAENVFVNQNRLVSVEEAGVEKTDRDSLERECVEVHQGGVDGSEFDPLKDWDKPMGLPAPNKPAGGKGDDKKTEVKKATSPTKPVGKQPPTASGKSQKTDIEAGAEKHAASSAAPKKTGKPSAAEADTSKLEGKAGSRSQATARKPAGPATANKAPLKPVTPFYVDLAYIPGHGAAEYVDIEFFRRVRARYYVLSTVAPDPATLWALVEAKSSWDDPEAMVTIIPTYDADVLRYWMAAHRDQLSQLRIDIAPSANRCTIQLQDHDSGCAAYRLEF